MNERYTDKSFQGFFTDAEDIRLTMIKLLGDVTDQKILEPCFGEGAFIKDLKGQPLLIDAIDIDKEHFNQTHGFEQCNYFHIDFIDYFVHPQNRTIELPDVEYDSTICNPPYGLKFTKEYRKDIKKKLPDVYARESYGLFFYLTLKMLREGGKYVFIMPDTFFTSTNLGYLRKFIVESAAPTHIIQFKSKRFGSVNFGYGNMCIIAGHKQPLNSDTQINWIDAISTTEPLLELLNTDKTKVDGEYLIKNYKESWISPKQAGAIAFNRDVTSLGDIASCRTGIYTGNNTEYCGYNENTPPKRINGHAVDWNNVILDPTNEQKQSGIAANRSYVRLIRGGHRAPFEETNSCIRWDKVAVDFYDKDKKARLQNKEFYFLKGLAIPMVTSGRLSASEMENAIFDQGVVGVFPNDLRYHDFLLIYLNDDFASKLKSLIAPGANNSANYLKKLKIPILKEDELKEASRIVTLAKESGWEETKRIRDNYIESILN